MKIQFFIYIPTLISLFLLGLLVYLKNSKTTANRTFILLDLFIILWLIPSFVADISSAVIVSLRSLQLAYLFSLLIPLFFVLFALNFLKKTRVSKKLLIPFVLPPLVLMMFSFSNANITEVAIREWGTEVTKSGIVYSISAIYFFLYALFALVILIRKQKKSTPIEKSQIRLIVYGTSIAALANVLTSYVFVFFGNSQYAVLFGIPTFIFFVGCITYAIIQHKLFDIRAVIARSLTYILSIGTLAALYGFVAFRISNIFTSRLTENWQNTYYIFLAVVLAFTFTPLRKFFERITNRIFFRDKYDPQDLANEVGRILASEIDLDKVSNRVLKEITSKIKIEKGEIIVFGEKQLFYENNVFKEDGEQISSRELKKLGRLLVVADDLQSGERKELMKKYGVSISLALRTSEKFIGYMLLGEKKSGDIYNDEDLKVLRIIAQEVSVAIANALSFKEIQLFSETLAERVRQRTAQLKTANDQLKELDQAKDEFISMASHQLRTPLTTVKGYASMLEEGDFGKLSKEQKDTVELTLDGANRMARLIDDLLNVSRMDANRFFLEVNEVDLNTLVEQEVQQLQSMAAGKQVKLIYTPPHTKIPTIRLDETKTRQVIMNLVDNAIHYSRPEGAEVQVSMKLNGSHVVFTVVDNGIGVPATAQGKLFTKMFRAGNAKTARPDGTGLGLYLVKRVVQDEGGELLFESTEGKGSTFGFRIPLSGIPKSVEEASKKIGAKVAAHPR